MCAPIALGAASFASGALGAVGNYQSAQAQASAQNQAAINNYKYQLQVRQRNWEQTRNVYGQKLFQFRNELDENNLAAGKAYAGAQNKLTEMYRQAAFSQQGMLAKLIQSQGRAAAAGSAGRSADRRERQLNATYGMNMATQAETLMGGQRAYTQQVANIRDQLRSQNNQAYGKVAIQPQPGVAPVQPVMAQGPSGLGLAAGILGAGVGGYSTYQELKNYQGDDGI